METPTLYVVRNEVDADCEYHCDALASHFPDAAEIDFARGERFDPADADGVVLTGSTAGVYEADDRPWIDDQAALVRDLVDRSVPTLGVCFGHQVVNAALGGTVEAVGTTARLVEADLTDDPLFDGVAPVVPAVHGDVVTEPGEGMEVVASAPHARTFGTRHRTAPLWTVQFHPEFGAEHRERLADDFDWERTDLSFADATTGRVFENFRRLAAEAGADA
ncbi:type 1 glutamine amidotransferase [Halostella litorea]|uniref:type 1 glutamine amidotransferase n=1 Tax=Halostella litorea TaxID=2528831 RepID=UPI001092F4FF|nr:type 1 glutamine amidotransferase [Halostella litorea]